MSLQSAPDVPLLVSSPNSSSERRISPSWSIAHLKARLEPITGIPAACQQLSLRVGSQDALAITAPDEDQTCLAAFPLQPYAEITVSASSHLSLHAPTSPVLAPSEMLSSRRLPHLLAFPPIHTPTPTPRLPPRLGSLAAPLKLPYLFSPCMCFALSLSYSLQPNPTASCSRPRSCHVRMAYLAACLPRNAPSIFVSLADAGIQSFGSSAIVYPHLSTELGSLSMAVSDSMPAPYHLLSPFLFPRPLGLI